MCIRAKKDVKATRRRAGWMLDRHHVSRKLLRTHKQGLTLSNEGTLRPVPETATPRASSEGAVDAVRIGLKWAALVLVLAGLALAMCSVR